MKKRLWLVVLAATTMLTSCEPAFARPEISLQCDLLTIKDGTRVTGIPNVPPGLSAAVAYDLVTGRIPEAVIAGPAGATTWSFDFPWVTSTTEHFDKMVSYSAKSGWTLPQAAPVRPVKTVHRFKTFVLFWISALLIMAVSALPTFGTGVKNIIFFYLTVFASSVGGTVGPMTGFFVGILACGISGFTLAKNAEVGFFVGALTGALVGASTGFIETTLCSRSLAAQYWFFLFVVECVSFAISRVLFPSKGKVLT
ncbi:MAG: hypothetical protein ACYC48_00465 [Minisyncoccota bacterium]